MRIKLKRFCTHVDKAEEVFICRKEVRADVLLQLRSVRPLQNKIEHSSELRNFGGIDEVTFQGKNET